MAANPPSSAMTTQPPPPRKGAYHKHIQMLHKDQHRTIQAKHSQEMLLLDSIKGFFKQRFALEKQHFEALSKICSSQYRAFDCIKKLPTKDPNSTESQPYELNAFSIWIEMLQSIEEKASNYASNLQTLEAEMLKDLKKLKACKQQRMKKFFERVAFLHKEVEASVVELDRTKRIYFNEESEALETKEKAQAADDIARGRKKDVKSFFLSHSKLKDKAGKLSVKQEEVDIRSTGARNDYILSVATANAHRGRYFENDFPEIVQLLEADLYDKVRSYYKKYIEVELERAKSGQELFDSLNTKTIRSSRGTNYQLFCVAYPSLTENISYTFENCPGDTIEQITTSEHDGGYSLNYEARQNASKLNQAVKTINAFEKRTDACQYHRSKGLTREPNDTGGPDLETKIVELQIAISNAHTDKSKAEARLHKLREGGIAVDEYIDAFVVERKRQQEAAEAQRARDAALAAAANEGSEEQENFALQEARADSFDQDYDQDQQPVNQTPAPAAQPVSYEPDNWASWDDAPAEPAEPAAEVEPVQEDWAAFDNKVEADIEPVESQAEAIDYDGLRQATVIYNFDAQNSDELTINENEAVFISNEECDEEGWVVCINAQGQKGYVPLNYLDLGDAEAIEEAPPETNGNHAIESTFEQAQPNPSVEDDNWGFNAFSQPTPAPAPAPAPVVSSQPAPWEIQENSSDEESEDEESASAATSSMPPPPDMPPPIPSCPPPMNDFSRTASIENSLSTFSTDYCIGMYDYDATGSDEISFKAGDKIKILNRIPNGVDDGWWKGMVKGGSFAGQVGLFPSIICEPLDEESDSEKTEDSVESPTSYSCAPPSSAPPPMSPPKTPNVGNSLSVNDDKNMEIVVTAPTPTVQSPVDPPARPAQPPPPPSQQQQPPAQPPRPPPAAPAKLEKQAAQDVPQVVVQETLDEISSPESEAQPEIPNNQNKEEEIQIKFDPPTPPKEEEIKFEAKFESPTPPEQEEEVKFEANFDDPPSPPPVEEKFEAKFEANFDPPPSVVEEEVEEIKEEPPKFDADFEAAFQSDESSQEKKPKQGLQTAISSESEAEFGTALASKEASEEKIDTTVRRRQSSSSDSSSESEVGVKKEDISESLATETDQNQPVIRSLKRVDTADSTSSNDDSSRSEGPVVKAEGSGAAAKSDSDSDSSDHIPPDDLHVKQLKKLDTLKESSA